MQPRGMQVKEQVASLEQSRALDFPGTCLEVESRGLNCRTEKWVWLSFKHTLARARVRQLDCCPIVTFGVRDRSLDYVPCVHILARR